MTLDADALTPYGLALRAYADGGTAAELLLRREDGVTHSLPVSHFFRSPHAFTPLEIAALERCRGRVLDVGAGTGLHTLELLSRGFTVIAIDLCPEAVEIMQRRGVPGPRCADVFDFRGGPFDTLLMLGHGIGVVGDLAGLDRFLSHAAGLIHLDGQLLVHSLDVAGTDDPAHLAYHEACRRAGRYQGEVRLRFEYEGHTGPWCGWLHVDPATLRARAEPLGWECETILDLEGGDYLARLTRRPEPPERTEKGEGP
ncbi:MAG: class I SAM-dependent methyltransferase [Gemmatimonadota bacterium]